MPDYHQLMWLKSYINEWSIQVQDEPVVFFNIRQYRMFIDTMLDSTSQLSRYWLLGIGTVLMDSSTIIWKVYQNVPLIATYLFEIGLFTCNAKIPMRNVWIKKSS